MGGLEPPIQGNEIWHSPPWMAGSRPAMERFWVRCYPWPMSYDLAVFEPSAPPPNHAGFRAWFKDQTKWGEGHRYDDPKITAAPLREWFLEMIQTYPALNGPYASKNFDDPKVTDYSVGRTMIYAGFPWSQMEGAFEVVFAQAQKHRVGFYDVSADDGQVWLPKNDKYIHVFGTGDSSKKLGKTHIYTLGFGFKQSKPLK